MSCNYTEFLKLDKPYNRESKRRVYVYEQRGNLVLIVEYQTIAPCDNRAGEGAMRETVTGRKQRRAGWQEPDVDEIENRDIIAQVEEEIMPGAFLVCVGAEG